MTQVLLIARDWQARALLRAQLIEDGIEVDALENVAEALKRVSERPRLHRLIVADLHASSDPGEELAALEQWARRVPVWVIASHSSIGESEDRLRARGFERVLFRPVDLGKLEAEIKARLALEESSRK